MQRDDERPPPLAELEAAVQHSPGDVVAWQRLGDGYCAAEMFELAVAVLTHALHLAPRDANFYGALGNALRETGRPREAIPHLQEAARLDPDSAAWRTFEIAAALDEAGDRGPAVDQFRKVLELNPRLTAAWIRLAFALSEQGRFAEAIPAFETATGRRPKSARLWAGLALAYERTGQPAKAEQAYRLAFRLDTRGMPPASCRRQSTPLAPRDLSFRVRGRSDSGRSVARDRDLRCRRPHSE